MFDLFTNFLYPLNRLEEEEEKVREKELSLVHEAVTDEEIARIVSRWTGIPVAKLNESERNKTLLFALC